jgi:hypothetical protein
MVMNYMWWRSGKALGLARLRAATEYAFDVCLYETCGIVRWAVPMQCTSHPSTVAGSPSLCI